MESIKSHCYLAYNSLTPSLPTAPALLFAPTPILPPAFPWLNIAVSISALPGGWSCRSRLWETCVGNLIWSPQDLSERPASVCEYKLDTDLIQMGDSLCQAGGKGQNQQASSVSWCGTTACILLTKRQNMDTCWQSFTFCLTIRFSCQYTRQINRLHVSFD